MYSAVLGNRNAVICGCTADRREGATSSEYLQAADGVVHAVHGFPPRQLLCAAEDRDSLLDNLRTMSTICKACNTIQTVTTSYESPASERASYAMLGSTKQASSAIH